MHSLWQLVAVMAALVPVIIAIVNRLKGLPWARGAPGWVWFAASFVLAALAVVYYVYLADQQWAQVAGAILIVGGAAAGIYDISSPNTVKLESATLVSSGTAKLPQRK